MSRVVLLLLALLWVPLGAATAHAEKRVALIVANGGYDKAALANPAVDAGLVGQSLETIGFDVTVIADASRDRFYREFAKFVREKAAAADIMLFYYAGHGFGLTGLDGRPANYLMPVDADVSSRDDLVLSGMGIELDSIVRSVSQNARITLVFIDACRNDPSATRSLGMVGRGAVAMNKTVGRGVFVGFSAQLGSVAMDGEPGRGSPFARAFAEKVKTPGLRLDDAFKEIRAAVAAETGETQWPAIHRDDLHPPLVLNASVPAAAPARRAAPDTGVASRFDAARMSQSVEAWRLFITHHEGDADAEFYVKLAAEELNRLLVAAARDDVRARLAEEQARLYAEDAAARDAEMLLRVTEDIERLEKERAPEEAQTAEISKTRVTSWLFRYAAKEIWEKRVLGLPLKNVHELVTLASIVQKETGRADEYGRVAAVYLNRLRRGMRLQSDPTIIYGLFGGAGKPPDRPIYRSDIEKPTPYNTYNIPGLPPGPIAIPGRAAMEAVANPAVTDDLYFVSDGAGGHVFAATLEEHNENVARYRALQRAREADARTTSAAAGD